MLQGADERRLRVLARLGGEFGRIVNRDELDRAIAALLRDEGGYDGVAVWRSASNSDRIELAASAGLTPTRPDIDNDAAGAQLVLPLVSHGQRIGAIGVRMTDPCALDEADVELLDSVGPAIAAACEVAALHETVRDAALTDPLTGLPNARAFGHALSQEIARSRRHGHLFALALVGAREPSAPGDRPAPGDAAAALREVALILRAHLRAADIVARHGMDDLVVLLPQSMSSDAASALERALAQTTVASSYGLAEFPRDGGDAPALLAAADRQLRVGSHTQTPA